MTKNITLEYICATWCSSRRHNTHGRRSSHGANNTCGERFQKGDLDLLCEEEKHDLQMGDQVDVRDGWDVLHQGLDHVMSPYG